MAELLSCTEDVKTNSISNYKAILNKHTNKYELREITYNNGLNHH